MKQDIKKYLLDDNCTLEDAMKAINKNAMGVAFIVNNKDKKLSGILTDGDIRRAILGSGKLEDSVAVHMNQNFVFGSIHASREENVALLNDKICHLPLLDSNGHPVELISWLDYWKLPIMQPSLGGNELKYVIDCLSANWISSQGNYVRQFENLFAKYHSVPHALCVSNGTAALHLALAALGVGPGDEVIVPDLTFAAPASMVILCGAKPVLVDVDKETWTLDHRLISPKITSKTRAIIPVHLYGHPCDLDPILEIAREHKLYVVEDCAEALGAEYRHQRVGTLGDIGTFSFFANKVITTGEGGMVITRDRKLYQKMTLLRDHGMSASNRYWHQVAGFNYRITNIQAAIGLAQMEQIDKFLAWRDTIVRRYDHHLNNSPGVTQPPGKPWAKNIHWLYSILVDSQICGIERDTLSQKLSDLGIETRPFFHPLHQQAPFRPEGDNHFPVTEKLAKTGLSLPTYNDIALEDVDRVCKAVLSFVRPRLNPLLPKKGSDII